MNVSFFGSLFCFWLFSSPGMIVTRDSQLQICNLYICMTFLNLLPFFTRFSMQFNNRVKLANRNFSIPITICDIQWNIDKVMPSTLTPGFVWIHIKLFSSVRIYIIHWTFTARTQHIYIGLSDFQVSERNINSKLNWKHTHNPTNKTNTTFLLFYSAFVRVI